MKLIKRMLSLLLTVCIAMSMAVTAYAAEEENTEDKFKDKTWEEVVAEFMAEYKLTEKNVAFGYKNLVTGEEHYINALSQGCFLIPDAEMVCGRLSRHFHLSLVTNGITRAQNGRLDKSGLRPYFQHIFTSEEVGADKPSEAFFDKVYETLGCPDKESMIIIGDSLSSDIRGGVNFGIHTCHVVLDGEIPEYKEIQPTYTIKELKELFTILYEQPVETE